MNNSHADEYEPRFLRYEVVRECCKEHLFRFETSRGCCPMCGDTESRKVIAMVTRIHPPLPSPPRDMLTKDRDLGPFEDMSPA